MVLLKRNRKIYVGKSTLEGYGVFTTESIEKKEILQECPFLPLGPDSAWAGTVKDLTFDLDYAEGIDYSHLKGSAGLAFGTGCMYNTATTYEGSSAEWDINLNTNTIVFYAIKDISPGEEILVFYGEDWLEERSRENYNVNCIEKMETMQQMLDGIEYDVTMMHGTKKNMITKK